MTNVMTVKKEIRILGLDTCRKGVIIGAVVGGGRYLDGVLRLHGADSTNTRAVAKYVRTSRYYRELRVVMTPDKRQTLSGKRLEKGVAVRRIQVATGPRPGYRR